jgi:hypothetical protein
LVERSLVQQRLLLEDSEIMLPVSFKWFYYDQRWGNS